MEQETFDDLHEHYAFTADAGQEPLRVDKFLMNRIEEMTYQEIADRLELSVKAIEKRMHKHYKNKNFEELQDELKDEKDEKNRLRDHHTKVIRDCDLKIAYLQVKSDELYNESEVVEDLKNLYRTHIQNIQQQVRSMTPEKVRPSSSSSKSRSK